MQPAATIHNHPQPATTTHNQPQPATTIHHPQPPATTHNHPQSPTTTHNHPHSSTTTKKDKKRINLNFRSKVLFIYFSEYGSHCLFLNTLCIRSSSQCEKFFKTAVPQLLLKPYMKILMKSLTFCIYVAVFY